MRRDDCPYYFPPSPYTDPSSIAMGFCEYWDCLTDCRGHLDDCVDDAAVIESIEERDDESL